VTPDEAFLTTIIASPDDPLPRLVYADYLEEHSKPEQAAYLRIQCELARLPADDPRRAMLEAREQDLLPAFARSLLKRRYDEFLIEPPNNLIGDAEVRLLGREHEALPIILDQGGWWAIRLDGTIVSWGWGILEDPEIETDLRWRNQALFDGTIKFPELWLFLPPRPASSRECHVCGGSGLDPQMGGSLDLRMQASRCPYCGGLKWVP